MPTSYTAKSVAQLGYACMALGALTVMDPKYNIVNQSYGFLLLVTGFVFQLQALRLRRQRVLPQGRYGPRGRYNTERTHEHINNIINESSERMFKSWLRVSRTSFYCLIELIKDDLVFRQKGRKSQIPVRYQLATYLVQHGSVTGTKAASTLQISEGSVYNYCARVTRTFRRLRPAYVRWPTAEERLEIKLQYQEDGFPGAIGSVDGNYIPLLDKPRERPMAYLCRKKFWAVNIQAVVDGNGHIISYDLGWPGSTPDITVWKKSHIWLHWDSYFAPDEWLFADGGYALTRYLIMPFQEGEFRDPDPQVNRLHKKWNKAFASQRIVVEHTFGRLKARFRYLCGVRGWDIGNIYRTIKSLIVLHNILHEFGDYTEDLGPAEAAEVIRQKNQIRMDKADFQVTLPEARTRNHMRQIGVERRRQLVRYWNENR